jgi:hypothetical protein
MEEIQPKPRRKCKPVQVVQSPPKGHFSGQGIFAGANLTYGWRKMMENICQAGLFSGQWTHRIETG